ncbi:protein NO VEIN domain-containing protein [Pectinatus sottacetonis]|uniref:protein NO VEIN domain-containing protein n=1 Tax=Pectinatus sottacetonis TaxID=1002795 RepID=UPI0018C4F9AC|nr:DUF3883 domain-containing protein [Pectinatus sottacetonis]
MKTIKIVKMVVEMINNFRSQLAFGHSNEEKAMKYIKEHFGNQIESIQFIEYNKKDNRKQQLYGDIEVKTTGGRTKYYEVKSRRKHDNCFCFEIDENKKLKTKYVDYYIFIIPDYPIMVVDYFEFLAVYDELAKNKPVRYVPDGEPVIFLPIDEVFKALNELNGVVA